MAYEVFTTPWAEAWAEELRGSEAYRKAAKSWEGGISLELTGDDERAVFLDLWHGECRAARIASAEDRSAAAFIIQADMDAWRRILAGDLDPIYGIMSGKLKLARGNMAGLLPFVEASKQLVAAAARIESTFPGD